MIVRQVLAVVALVGLAAASAAHLLNNEVVAELAGNVAFAALGLAALFPSATYRSPLKVVGQASTADHEGRHYI